MFNKNKQGYLFVTNNYCLTKVWHEASTWRFFSLTFLFKYNEWQQSATLYHSRPIRISDYKMNK